MLSKILDEEINTAGWPVYVYVRHSWRVGFNFLCYTAKNPLFLRE